MQKWMLLFLPMVAMAQEWIVDGSENWNSAVNWNPSTVPNGIDQEALLGSVLTAPATINLNTNITLGSLTFNNANAYTIQPTVAQTITFDVSTGNAKIIATGATGLNGHNIQAKIILNKPLEVTVESTQPFIIAGNIEGTGNLIKNGSKTLRLNDAAIPAANNFSGTSIVQSGTLELNMSNIAIPGNLESYGTLVSSIQANQFATTSQVTLYSGLWNLNGLSQTIQTLILRGGNLVNSNNLTLSNASGPALILGPATISYPLVINQGSVIFDASAAGTATISQPLQLNNNTPFIIAKGTNPIDLNITGALTAPNGFIKNGPGTMALGAASSTASVTLQEGELQVNALLSVANSMNVQKGAKLSGTGTISTFVSVRGTIAPGSSSSIIGVLSLGDTLSLLSGSITEININPSACGRINIAQNLAIDAGAKVIVLTEAGHHASEFINYDQAFVVTTTGVSGIFSSLNTARFYLDYSNPNEVHLRFKHWIYSQEVQGGNPGAVANTLDIIGPALGSDLDWVIDQVLMNDPSHLREFFNLLHPAMYKGLVVTQEKNSICFGNALFSHLRSYYEPADWKAERRNDIRFWINGLGDYGKQRKMMGNNGFRGATGGVIIGYDWKTTKNFFNGLVAGYTYSDVKWEHKQGHGNINSAYGGIYTTYFNKTLFLEGLVYGGYNLYKNERNIHFSTINRRAKGSSHGAEVGAQLRHGYSIPISKLILSPYLGCDYVYLHQNKFSERGADSLDLDVRKSEYSYLRGELGFFLSQTFNRKTLQIIPDLKLAVSKDARFKGSRYRAKFQDTSPEFTVTGIHPNRVQGSYGLGLTIVEDRRFNFVIHYDGEVSSHYWNHNLNMSFSNDF